MPGPLFDPESVRELFDDMASTYGRVNLISSFGFTARWRRQAVEGLPLASATLIVDLMSGMGELWRSISATLPAAARIIGVDLSLEMIRRARRAWPFRTEVHQADALTWTFPPGSVDAVVSSFGLKTLDRDQQRDLAARVSDLLRPGGVCSFVEISVPPFAPLRALFLFYIKRVIPVIGRLFLGNSDTYRMLGVYTELFGDASHFTRCLRDAGVEARFVSLFFGCATGVRGVKR